jgi:hypothetical protein
LVDVGARLLDKATYQILIKHLNSYLQWCDSIVRCFVDVSTKLLSGA